MDNQQYLDAFLAETEDNLSALNELCLVLEQSGADDGTFAAMFRAAHTLKGMSATMGFKQMADLTHRMEDALGHVRSHVEVFGPPVVDTLFEAIDALTSNLQVIRDTGDESGVNHSRIINHLSVMFESQGTDASASTVPLVFDETAQSLMLSLAQSGQVAEVLELELEAGCVMKGVRMVMVMRALEQFGTCIATVPDAPTLEEGDFTGAVRLAIVLENGTIEDCAKALRDITEVERVGVIDWQRESSVQSSMPEVAAAVEATAAVAPEMEQTSTVAQERVHTAPKTREQTLRVPVSRIDEFMNVLSELVIAKTRLELLAQTLGDVHLRDATEQIARLSESLQDGVMSMRMMPVESLFQRFPRMMRDLQKSLGREFDFEMSGLETEMDRTVMDEMGEALVHLLRNAADHGLETPEARERVGKPRRGTIRLSAYASGGHVYIEVADDGGGIQRDGVLKSAIAKGIVTAAHAASMTDGEVHELLFASGFSTAKAVSDISGRGVGLDAVRGKVTSLGGNIRIESVPMQGTTFIIELPLTLTILPAMLIRVGQERFALPTGNIEEVAQLQSSDIEWVHERPVVRFRDKVVPIFDLGSHFFGQSSQQDTTWNVVFCRDGKRVMALTVDDVIDELEVVNKPLGKFLEGNQLFSGATILGDGHVALIVDVHQVFQVTA